jgi:multiple sugar transport system ATP-binding protein
MARLQLTDVHKRYGGTAVIAGVSLEIAEGEFTVLLGPSGCGKSTLLRIIAGLEDADAGVIAIDGEAVNHVRAKDRDVAMVFQNYALYPYMTVFENIAFGLRMRKMPEDELRRQVDWAAGLLSIADLLERFPRQLSGGQRQRVAMGRAMVRRPRLFLFDEPLSNLDAQLREGMRGEIKRLHQALPITTIYVTHDQTEAMTLADRVVLLNRGRIEQAGDPMDLYERPANRFVAGFLGSPSISFVAAELEAAGGGLVARLDAGLALTIPPGRAARLTAAAGRKITLGIRPEHVTRGSGPEAEIVAVEPAGPRIYVRARLAGSLVTAELTARDRVATGERLNVEIDMESVVLLDAETGNALEA